MKKSRLFIVISTLFCIGFGIYLIETRFVSPLRVNQTKFDLDVIERILSDFRPSLIIAVEVQEVENQSGYVAYQVLIEGLGQDAWESSSWERRGGKHSFGRPVGLLKVFDFAEEYYVQTINEVQIWAIRCHLSQTSEIVFIATTYNGASKLLKTPNSEKD